MEIEGTGIRGLTRDALKQIGGIHKMGRAPTTGLEAELHKRLEALGEQAGAAGKKGVGA